MMNRIFPLMLMGAVLAGCSSKDTELENFIRQTKTEQPAGVEPIPEMKLHEKYRYSVADARSPFIPYAGAAASKLRPDTRRNREHLEQFPMDSLKFKGTIQFGGRQYGLIQTSDGKYQRVLPGNYLGENDGRILKIEPSRITITEIVADGSGGFIERGAALELQD